MSAPKTDPEKHAKRHKGPLAGLTGVILWALVLLVGLTIFVVFRANDPGNEQPIEADRAGVGSEVDAGSADLGTTGSATEAE